MTPPSLRRFSASTALCVFSLLSTGLRAELLKNGDMSAGETTPASWDKRWVGTGKLISTRDQAIFKSAPASLRISAQDGSAKGQIYQMIPVTAGEQLTASGWIKCEGADTTAQFGLQFFTADYKPISTVQVRYIAGTTDWTTGKLTTAAPANSTHVGFLLLLDGDGQAWLDDARLERKKPSADSAAPSQIPITTTAHSAGAAADSVPPAVFADDGSTLIAALADFRQQGLSYGYESWKTLSTVATRSSEGLTLAGPANGGAGIVYPTAAPIDGATHLRVRLRANAGHSSPLLHVKIMGSTEVMTTLPTTGLPVGEIVTRFVALPAKTPLLVKQVQIQGTFNPADKIALTLVDAAFVRVR